LLYTVNNLCTYILSNRVQWFKAGILNAIHIFNKVTQ
jgi:hypothetical protein